MTAETLMLICGTGQFLITVYWVRKRELREKYAIVWLGLATMLLLVGIFPTLIMDFADWTHLSFPAAALFFALAAIYLYAFTVSISLSHQYRRSIRLSQEIALLEQRIRTLETEQS